MTAMKTCGYGRVRLLPASLCATSRRQYITIPAPGLTSVQAIIPTGLPIYFTLTSTIPPTRKCGNF